jgi:hypothetical protein
MEKFMNKKIALGAVAILVLVLGLGAFFFGVLVREYSAGNGKLGPLARYSYRLASIPSEAVNLYRHWRDGNITGMVTLHSDRFPGQSGWTFHDARLDSGLDGYLLFSRYDGDVGSHVFELIDLKSGEQKYRFEVDATRILANANRGLTKAAVRHWETSRFQGVHPIVLDNGDIMAKGHYTPMFSINPCGDVVWLQDKFIFHHTIERAPDGNYWSPSYVEPQRVEGLHPRYEDSGLVKLSEEGEILFDRSLSKIFLDHGLGSLILSGTGFDPDPLHLNDIQPVFEDSPYWKRGDVFLSIRSLSMIMLYRPSTDEIIWWRQGDWTAQHDVDIINETTIGVFDNNVFDYGDGPVVNGHSRVLYYDFATDQVSSPFDEILAENEFKNEAAGLFTLLPDGHLYVSESESGRTLIFTPDGEIAVEHVNRAKNGNIFHLGWSRYMDRAAGDRFLEQINTANCAPN